MKSTNDLKTSNPEMVTISRTEYEEKNARLAFQDERISRLESQIALLTEALRLASTSGLARPRKRRTNRAWSS